MKENKDLIEYSGGLFSRIKEFFKKIFARKKQTEEIYNEVIEQDFSNANETNESNGNTIIEVQENTEIEGVKALTEKEEFFKVYNDFKNGKISGEDLPLSQLLRINKMLDEENKIKVKDYQELVKIFNNNLN